jgi:hypothetical protein
MCPKFIVSFLLISIGLTDIFAQNAPWDIPKEAKEKTAPFLFNDSIRKAGETIYITNCKSCHGDPGKANHAKLDPIPRDPATPEYQIHTDGDMYFILSTGRGLMPNFSTTLTEEQRWQVISFVRTFNKSYVQPPVKLAGSGDVTSTIKMSLIYDEKLKSVIVTLIDKAKDKNIPVSNIPVKLFVKRTFGNMQIGEVPTDVNGKARIHFPEDLPGDTAGNLNLIAIAGTGGKQIIVEKTEKIGVGISPKLLLDERAWWNVRSKAPIWLIIAYVCGGIAVGCCILYVALQLKKIKEINQLNKSGHE